MSKQVNVFLKMDDLKNKPYFKSLRSKCGIYELASQGLNFTDEVLIVFRSKESGLTELLVRMNGSDYFTDVSADSMSELMEEARTVTVDTAKSTAASKMYQMTVSK